MSPKKSRWNSYKMLVLRIKIVSYPLHIVNNPLRQITEGVLLRINSTKPFAGNSLRGHPAGQGSAERSGSGEYGVADHP